MRWIRALEIDDLPHFVGKDVADALGYSNARDAIKKHVDAEDKGVANCDTLGGKQKMTIINESGIYSLILGSGLETAKKFEYWETSEVIH
ncbi:MAG: Bro-N domain-containing protein [Clostridiales bacterium]|nr:Bro-N domain-containing protein [Clostridiales bacterium]